MEKKELFCKGENHFFWLPGGNGRNIQHSIFERRMKATDEIFNNPVFICLECRSSRRTNHQMKGHTAMIFYGGKWELVVIWKQISDQIVAFPFDAVTLFNTGKKLVFDLNKDDYFLKYVNIYFPDMSWMEGKLLSEKDMKELCCINPIDGCLDGRPSPTLIDLPLLSGYKSSVEEKKHNYAGQKKGKKRKRRKKNVSTNDLDQKWLTIYVKKHDPLKSITSSASPVMMVPEMGIISTGQEPFFKKIFHAVRREDLKELDCSFASIYQERLRRLSLAKYSMVGFHHSNHPVRFSVLDDDAFRLLPSVMKDLNKFEDCLEPFYWNYDQRSNLRIPGVVVSMWDTLDSIKNLFPLDHYLKMQDRVGKGYGDRHSVPCGGVNAYFGPNNSTRPVPSPIYGPGTRKEVDYDRNYYHHDEYHQELVRKLRMANSMILHHARTVDAAYMNFLESMTRSGSKSGCYRILWTQGTSGRVVTTLTKVGKLVTKNLEVRKHQGIGFYNKPHYDHKDRIPAKNVSNWIEDDALNDELKSKVQKMQEEIGVGFPTTVGYNFCSASEAKVSAYFTCWGFFTPITEKSFHHFYGWSFPHCSTVPLYMRKSLIVMRNEEMPRENGVYIGAWGYNNRFEMDL